MSDLSSLRPSQGDVNEWNNKTAEITGYTKEEAWNKPLVSTFIVASLRQSVQEVLDNALQGRETSNYELEFRTKSNEIRYLLVNATTRRDPHNNIVGVVGVAQASTILLYPFGPLAVLMIFLNRRVLCSSLYWHTRPPCLFTYRNESHSPILFVSSLRRISFN